MGKSTKWLGKFLGVKKFKSSNKEKPTSDSPPEADEQSLNSPAKHQDSPLPSETDSQVAPMEVGNENSSPAVALKASPIINSAAVSLPDGFLSTGNASAIKIQTAFRAFLVTRGVMVDDFVQARRALRALKGLVRLQALVRGHSVRKQAAISLRTVLAIVKLQALARGHRIRMSDEGQSVQKQIWNKRQSSSALGVEPGDGDAFTSIKVEAKRSKADVSRFDQKIIAYAPSSHTLFKDGDEQAEWWWLELWSGAGHWKPAPAEVLNAADTNSLRNGEVNGDQSDSPAAGSGKNSARRSKVPSYMAATESAKAKARNSSPRMREITSPTAAETVDKLSPAFKRRFSLPGTQGRFQDPITHPRRLSFPVRAR